MEDESSRRKRHQSAAGINDNAEDALGSSKVGGEVKEVVGLDVDGKDGDGEKNDASAAAIFNSTSRNKEGVDVDDVLPKPPSSTNSDKVNVQGVEGGKDAADSTAGGALNDVGTGGGGDLKDDDMMMDISTDGSGDTPPTEKGAVEDMKVEYVVWDESGVSVSILFICNAYLHYIVVLDFLLNIYIHLSLLSFSLLQRRLNNVQQLVFAVCRLLSVEE